MAPVEGRHLLGHGARCGADGSRHLEILGELVLVVVDPIAAEKLVGTFAGLNDLHLFGGQLADEIQGDGRRRAQRLVHVVLLGGDDVQEFLGRHLHVLVFQPRPVGELVGVVQLVQLDAEAGVLGGVFLSLAAGNVVAHAEGLHALFVVLAHAIGGQRRIDAAGQEAADFHVSDFVRAHRFVEGAVDDVSPLFQILGVVDLIGDLVEALVAHPVALDNHEMAGQHLVNVLEHGLRIVHVLEAQVLGQHLLVHGLVELGVRQHALDFRRVHEAFALLLVVERLNAEDIAGQNQTLAHIVPDSDGEHAAQAFEHPAAPFFIAVQDGFGVAIGEEGVARSLQFFAQVLEVVDFAVEGDDDIALLVLHGLVALRQVDDGQAAEAHGDVVVHKVPVLIGAAVLDAVGHVLHDRFVCGLIVINRGESYESAHAHTLLFSTSTRQ